MENLEKVINSLKKKYGENSIFTGNNLSPVKCFPTGIPTLDYALGGGLIWGRQLSIAGKKGSGKTSICYEIAGNFQKINGTVFWIDIEKQFDLGRAKVFGIGEDKLVVVDENITSENLFNIVKDIILETKAHGIKCLIVIDSLQATSSEKSFEELANKSYAGAGTAIVNNQSIRVWNALLGKNQILIIVNQLRMNIGSMGEVDRISGGTAQEYHASNIIWTREGETIKDGDEILGFDVTFTVKKTRLGHSKGKFSIPYYYKTGFDSISSLIHIATITGVLEKVGSWYKLPEGMGIDYKIQGEKNLIKLFEENNPLLEEMKKRVYSKFVMREIWDGEN